MWTKAKSNGQREGKRLHFGSKSSNSLRLYPEKPTCIAPNAYRGTHSRGSKAQGVVRKAYRNNKTFCEFKKSSVYLECPLGTNVNTVWELQKPTAAVRNQAYVLRRLIG
eukprot:1683628-Amphidinium_carterae.1